MYWNVDNIKLIAWIHKLRKRQIYDRTINYVISTYTSQKREIYDNIYNQARWIKSGNMRI